MLLCTIMDFVDFHYELLWTVWTINMLMYMVLDECGIYLYVWTCCIEVKYSSHICVWIASKNRGNLAKIFCLKYVLISVISFSGSLSNQFVFCYEYAGMPVGLPHWLRLSFLSCKRTEHDYVPRWLRFSFLSFHFMQKNWTWLRALHVCEPILHASGRALSRWEAME